MATTADIRNNAVILFKSKNEGDWFQHMKPGKGGAFVRTKLKDIQTEKLLIIHLIQVLGLSSLGKAKQLQYLFVDGENYVFMDNDTYDN